MVSIEFFKNLNYKNELHIIEVVRALVEKNSHNFSLQKNMMYVFHYELHAGDFDHLDIFKNSENGQYTDDNFITAYKRLFITHDGQGNFYLYFDGRQARMTCDFWHGKWESNFFDYLEKPFAVFKQKYS